jgi:hypothetical protein
MSSDSVEVIMVKLEHMEGLISQIHEEVKRTNGRVTMLEMENARHDGDRRGKQLQHMITASVISGGLLAVLIWFVSQAI